MARKTKRFRSKKSKRNGGGPPPPLPPRPNLPKELPTVSSSLQSRALPPPLPPRPNLHKELPTVSSSLQSRDLPPALLAENIVGPENDDKKASEQDMHIEHDAIENPLITNEEEIEQAHETSFDTEIKTTDIKVVDNTEGKYYNVLIKADEIEFTLMLSHSTSTSYVSNIEGKLLENNVRENDILIGVDNILVSHYTKNDGPEKLKEYIKQRKSNNVVLLLERSDSTIKIPKLNDITDYKEESDQQEYRILPYDREKFVNNTTLPKLSLKDSFIFDQLLLILNYKVSKYGISRYVYSMVSSPQENMLYYLLSQTPDNGSLLNRHLTQYLEKNFLKSRIKKMKQKNKLYQLCKFIGLFNSTGFPFGYEPLNEYHSVGLERLKKIHDYYYYFDTEKKKYNIETDLIIPRYKELTKTRPPLLNILLSQYLDSKSTKSQKALTDKLMDKKKLSFEDGLFTLDGTPKSISAKKSTERNKNYFNTTKKVLNRTLHYSLVVSEGILKTAFIATYVALWVSAFTFSIMASPATGGLSLGIAYMLLSRHE